MGKLTEKEMVLYREQIRIKKEKEEILMKKMPSHVVEFINCMGNVWIKYLEDTVVGEELLECFEKGYKPSDYFRENEKFFAEWIGEHLLEDFYISVDNVIYWQYAHSMDRRTLREKDYRRNIDNIGKVIKRYHEDSVWGLDVLALLKGEVDDGAKAYMKYNDCRASQYLIAAELDRGNKELEEYLENQIYEDGGKLDTHMIRGILLSKNERLYEALGKLLLAARLQEGIRQAICENMDCGREEAFLYLLKIVIDEDFIRFSSVKRAAGTWTGIFSDYVYDANRVSKKQIELLYLYLSDEAARNKALQSEDTMEVYLALWALGCHDAKDSFNTASVVFKKGSAHQRLVAMYYIEQMTDARFSSVDAVINHDDELPLLSIAIPIVYERVTSILRDVTISPYNYVYEDIRSDKYGEIKRVYAELSKRFGNAEKHAELYDHLDKILSSMSKKKMTFEPIIFPWLSKTLSKSQVLVIMGYIASALKDEKRMDHVLDNLDQVDGDYRSKLLALLAAEPMNEKQREKIVTQITNAETATRATAFHMLKYMELTKDEYGKLEDSLKSKKADIRNKSIYLLSRLEGNDIKELILRLIDSSVDEKHLSAMDLLMELKKDESRKDDFDNCVELLDRLEDPTEHEKILINEIAGGRKKKEKADKEALFDPDASYEPVIDDAWIKECKESFAKTFPDSVFVSLFKRKNEFKELLTILKGLDDLVEANKDKEFRNYRGEMVLLENLYDVSYYEEGKWKIRLDEVWRSFLDEKKADYSTLLKLSMLVSRPENQDYYNFFKDSINKFLGKEYAEEVSLKHTQIVRSIIGCYMKEKEDKKLLGRLAATVIYYFAVESKTPLVYSWTVKEPDYDPDADEVINVVNNYHRTIIDHGILEDIMKGFDGYEEDFDKYFPLHYVYGKNKVFTFKEELGSRNYFRAERGEIGNVKMEDYYRAYSLGIITEEFLIKSFWQQKDVEHELAILTDYVKSIRDKGRQIAKRGWNFGSADAEKAVFFKNNDAANERMAGIFDKIYDTASSIILESELKRGEAPTEYSSYVPCLSRIYGADYFARILVALGSSKLERGYGYFQNALSKTTCLCRLLSACVPLKDETAEDLKRALKGKKISEKRLLEAALYSPEWIDIVGDYLGWEGFTSCSYYFMAHMNEYFDDKRSAMVAKFTPLSTDSLREGAFDSNWFKEVYETIGPKHFKEMYDSCKYITNGAKHTRARKYADAALGNLNIEETIKEIEAKRNKDLLMALGAIPSKSENDLRDRYVFIKKFEKESRNFGMQRRTSEKLCAEIAVENMALANGYQDSMRFILRMESKVAEGLVSFFEPKEIEDVLLYLEASEDGKISTICEKGGKKQKSIPAKLKKDSYVLEMSEAKKELSNQFSRAKKMFENAMEEETVFSLGEIRDLAGSPVIRPIAEKLVFKLGDEFGFLSDFENKKNDDEVLIAHPFHLYKSGKWHELQKHIFDEKIVQPFKQVFRELYVKTEDERDCLETRRFAGNQIQPRRTLALLRSRGWIADTEEGLQKVYYKNNIIATIYALADWFSPSDIEAPTLEKVLFYDRKTFESIKISEVPDIIFSEVMRDVDLAVSVAHAGGVDPEFSHSTVEMRRAIAEFSMPLFKLSNVTFTDNHAIIKGKRGEYTVHLGSGVVHLAGGPMINVLPVHSQSRGRIFLPFVDDDPKTSEVMSKIVLFAQDDKIKDPYILNQI